MKIYVVGNCQSHSLAACLAAMHPAWDVERLEINVDPAPIAAEGDLIFRQRNPRIAWTLREPRPNEFLFPRIFFNAFHPDLVHVDGPTGRVAPPLVRCHSSLVLYGWQRGLSRARTAALFCEPVFERLGFFSRWEPAKQVLLEEGAATGCRVDAFFAAWQRSGAFMHASTHPALHVMADIARATASGANIVPVADTPEYYVNDPLLTLPVWPVYPEIADRLGCAGGYAFKKAQQPGWGTLPEVLDLHEFVAGCFEAYAHTEPAALACSRLNDPAYRDLEDAAGGARRTGGDRTPVDEAGGAAGRERERRLALEHRDLLAPGTETEPTGLIMDRLDPASMRAPVQAVLPATQPARSAFTIPCTVENAGDVALTTGRPYPVYLSYRWYDLDGNVAEVGNSIHTSLPEPLEPGASVALAQDVTAPQQAGTYRLCVALLQSNVAWFDDIDPANGALGVIDVLATSLRSGAHGG